MTKPDIAAILDEIALLLELKGENPFKIRAYVNGARALENFDGDLAAAIESGDIRKISGIGDALAEKIATLLKTGSLPFYEKLRAEIPPGLLQMLDIPGLGPKKIKILHEKLGIDTIAKLQAACQADQVAALAGFGKKTQDKLIDGIKHREAYSKRHLWWDAHQVAEPILTGLRQLPQVNRAEHAGSLRRGLETVGDLDFIVGSADPSPIMDWFTTMPAVEEVTAKGETKSSVRLAGGLQADLRVVPPAQFASALHHFTGSKAHNVKLRQRALARGWSLSEWGITPKDESTTATPPTLEDESALFQFLGLHYIPPELREGLDEIEAAESGPLPRLIEEGDIRGVFHNHTTASDGRNTLEEMATAAQALGFEYLGIADHSKSSFQANGLDEARLEAQVKRIRELNASGRFQLRILTGTECDILPDGSLDLPDSILRELDYVVVSVHSSFSQSAEEMTARICRALEHPLTTMLGHLTGRLLLKRESYTVDIAKVIDTALAHHKIIELNAAPQRLELDWRHWKAASTRGLLCSINPDAHSTSGLSYYRAGVRIARKGWLTPDKVINTKTTQEVLKYLARS